LTDSEQPGNYNQWVSKKGLGKKICELDALGSADGFSDLSEGSLTMLEKASKRLCAADIHGRSVQVGCF